MSSTIAAAERLFGIFAMATRTACGVATRGRPRTVGLEERLEAFPTHALPLRQRVSVHWNRHQVPFIEASTDTDLATALGGVHAHLRLAQIEFMRRIAQGRLSEAFGAGAVDVDQALRILDVGRAVPHILRTIPQETANWLAAFAAGINAYIDQLRRAPYELALVGIDPAPWTPQDVLLVGRLAAADFTWKVWLRLIRLRQHPEWSELWSRLTGSDPLPSPSFAGGSGPLAMMEWALGALDRGGSNSVAVGAKKTGTGAAMIASDPHLSIMLPNLWLLAGCRSPGLHAVGFMVPGIPAFALGRNPWIAWGGTSLHAASSDLVDVGGLPPGAITERHERIRVRWGPDRKFTARESPYGPVISDAKPLGVADQRPFALRWVGHDPSDELTALLRVNRARDWRSFKQALEGFAIPAQNMVYADAEGNVGQAMAARLPKRPFGELTDIVSEPEAVAHWQEIVGIHDLPDRFAPDDDVVASSNNAPSGARTRVGFFFSPDDRVRRARSLLSAERVTRETLQRLQSDVSMPRALDLRDGLVELLDESGATAADAIADLRAWNGVYDQDSRGALAFELLIYHMVVALHGEDRLAVFEATWNPWALLRLDLATMERSRLVAAAADALTAVGKEMSRLSCWGDAHRLSLKHPFAAVPFFGRHFRYADLPWRGANETLMKAAFGFSGGRHEVRLGANGRHISDLSDVDANWFVLFGGQDGWLGSTTFLDQFELWREDGMIQMPLRPESVLEAFPHAMTLEPAAHKDRHD